MKSCKPFRKFIAICISVCTLVCSIVPTLTANAEDLVQIGPVSFIENQYYRLVNNMSRKYLSAPVGGEGNLFQDEIDIGAYSKYRQYFRFEYYDNCYHIFDWDGQEVCAEALSDNANVRTRLGHPSRNTEWFVSVISDKHITISSTTGSGLCIGVNDNFNGSPSGNLYWSQGNATIVKSPSASSNPASNIIWGLQATGFIWET